MAEKLTPIRMPFRRHFRCVLYTVIPMLVFAMCMLAVVRIWRTKILPPQATGTTAAAQAVLTNSKRVTP